MTSQSRATKHSRRFYINASTNVIFFQVEGYHRDPKLLFKIRNYAESAQHSMGHVDPQNTAMLCSFDVVSRINWVIEHHSSEKVIIYSVLEVIPPCSVVRLTTHFAWQKYTPNQLDVFLNLEFLAGLVSSSSVVRQGCWYPQWCCNAEDWWSWHVEVKKPNQRSGMLRQQHMIDVDNSQEVRTESNFVENDITSRPQFVQWNSRHTPICTQQEHLKSLDTVLTTPHQNVPN